MPTIPMETHTVLVLGGGVGGVVAASRLRKLLPRSQRIVLIDRVQQQVFQPSLLWVAVGKRQPDRIQRPLARLRRKGIDVVIGDLTRIDAARCSVQVNGQELRGDAMIIALGAELAPEMVPGLAAAGHDLYTIDGARNARDAIGAFTGGHVVILTAAPAYKCPAAPYEAAMLIEAELRRRGVRRDSEVHIYAAEPGPMGVAGPDVSKAVRQVVESKGIHYRPEHQVTAVDPAARRLSFLDGSSAPFDILLYVPPHRAPGVVREAGLTSASGWIEVDRHTFETRFSGVYAIGDVTSIPLTMGKPLPKAGVFAHAAAEVVAANIANAWRGRPGHRRFDGKGQCFLETGDGRAGFGAGNFYAEPAPRITLRAPNRWWHWGKVLFEQRWLARWR